MGVSFLFSDWYIISSMKSASQPIVVFACRVLQDWLEYLLLTDLAAASTFLRQSILSRPQCA